MNNWYKLYKEAQAASFTSQTMPADSIQNNPEVKIPTMLKRKKKLQRKIKKTP